MKDKEIITQSEKALDWIIERVKERDSDGGWTYYTEFSCPKCGHSEKYKGTSYCSSCGQKMKI